MQNLMSIAAKYQGNPYAAKYSESLLEHLRQQSDVTATGTGDAQGAVDKMNEREEFESKMTSENQAQEKAQFELRAAEGARSSRIAQAQSLIQQGNGPSTIGPKLTEKLLNGDELTPLQQATVAQGMEIFERQQNKRAELELRQPAKPIPDAHISSPGEWTRQLWKDKPFAHDYTEVMTILADSEKREFLLQDKDTQIQKLLNEGIPPLDIDAFIGAGEESELVTDLFERMSVRSGARRKAQGIAMLRRLPALEREQPEISGTIDDTLQFVEDGMRHRNAESENPAGGREMNKLVEQMRADRHRVFFFTEYGYDPTQEMTGGQKDRGHRAPKQETPFDSRTMKRSPLGTGIQTPQPQPTPSGNPKLSGLGEDGLPKMRPAKVKKIPVTKGLVSFTRDLANPRTWPGAAVDLMGTETASALRATGLDYLQGKGTPGRIVLDAMGEAGMANLNKAAARQIKRELMYPVSANPKQWPYDTAKGIVNQLGREARSLLNFATTGSFAPSSKVKETSSASKPSPKPSKIVPSLDSFEKVEAPEREHYRDRERRE